MTETTREERLARSVRSAAAENNDDNLPVVWIVEQMAINLRETRDRLAAIDRQVVWRTEDTPWDARWWGKDSNGSCYWCHWPGQTEEERRASAIFTEDARDYWPDEPGPLFLPILDPPEG